MTDRADEAAPIYEMLISDFPKQSNLYYSLADNYVKSEQYDKALETIANIQTIFGVDETTTLAKFDILCQIGKDAEAYEMLEEFNRTTPSAQILSILGDYQLSLYNDSAALEFYDEALDLVPSYPPAFLGKVEVFRMTRKYDEYFTTLEQFVREKQITLEGKSSYLTAIVQRSNPYFLESFSGEFDRIFGAIAELYEDNPTALQLAGTYYYATKRNEQAKVYFKALADSQPEDIEAVVTYAEFLIYTEDWQDAADFAAKAYVEHPYITELLEIQVYSYRSLSQYDLMLKACEKLIAASTEQSAREQAYLLQAEAYHAKGENDKAFKVYDKVLKLNPENNGALNNYAYYLCLGGKELKKAAAMSKKTVEAEPDNPTYLDTYGWILHLQGKNAEAKPLFKHAMLYGGKDKAVILDHYADVLFALGETELAFIYWNQALSKDTAGELPNLSEKIAAKRKEARKK